MAKRTKRVDELELPAAIGNAIATYFGPRRFAKFDPELRRDIANAANDCAAAVLASFQDMNARGRRPPGAE